MTSLLQARLRLPLLSNFRAGTSQFLIAVLIILLASYLIAPLVMMTIMAFNVAPDMLVPPYEFGFDNWSNAWREPMLLKSLWNSVLIWTLTVSTSLPVAIAIAWVLGRTNVRGARALELMFWAAFMFPGLSSTIGWMMILDPEVGYANNALRSLGLAEKA